MCMVRSLEEEGHWGCSAEWFSDVLKDLGSFFLCSSLMLAHHVHKVPGQRQHPAEEEFLPVSFSEPRKPFHVSMTRGGGKPTPCLFMGQGPASVGRHRAHGLGIQAPSLSGNTMGVLLERSKGEMDVA